MRKLEKFMLLLTVLLIALACVASFVLDDTKLALLFLIACDMVIIQSQMDKLDKRLKPSDAETKIREAIANYQEAVEAGANIVFMQTSVLIDIQHILGMQHDKPYVPQRAKPVESSERS